MPTPREICAAKFRATPEQINCFDRPGNTREARIAAGLNPIFSGCPNCHNLSRDNADLEEVYLDMAQFMESLRGPDGLVGDPGCTSPAEPKPNNELGFANGQVIIGEDGYPDDEFLARIPTDPDSPAACLWDAMGNLCVTLYSEPNNSPVQAAIWQIQEAIIKLHAGENFVDPRKADEVNARIAEMKAKHGVA